MKAQRAAVSTAPIGVVAPSVEVTGWSFLPPRAPVAGRGAGACFGCAAAGNTLAAYKSARPAGRRRVAGSELDSYSTTIRASVTPARSAWSSASSACGTVVNGPMMTRYAGGPFLIG